MKPEEKVVTPRVDGFKLFAKRLSEPDEIIDKLSSASFLEIAKEEDRIVVLNVESRNIRKEPYLFSTIYMKPDAVEVVYSLVPGMSPRKRRIDVLRHLLNILTLTEGAYEFDLRYLFQTLQSALADITEFASSEYKEIFAKYDSLLKEHEELRKRVEELESANTKLGKSLVEARARNDELQLRVSQLESYTDEALMVKIQDWLDVHNNQINISEFSKQYGVLESRVEEVLNKMVLAGYLELRD